MTVKFNNKAIPVAIHITLWLLSFQFMFEISGLYHDIKDIMYSSVVIIDDSVIIIPLLISVFYINGLVLVKKLLNKKFWWAYMLSTIALITSSTLLSILIFNILTNSGIIIPIDIEDFIEIIVSFCFLTCAISTSIYASKAMFINYEKQKAAVEKQKRTEIELLSSQINPHFLFNTLNSIYYLSSQEQSPKTTESILKLSEIMRYPVNEGHKRSVDLDKEISFLKDYIDLQKLRLGNDYPINIKFPERSNGFKIAPLLFIPFIENSFKYGISTSKPKDIDIYIGISDNELTFRCSNYIVKSSSISSNLGIRNVKERLKLLYNNRHRLSINQVDNIHIVNLIIIK